jgi:hypothetical protein
MSILRRREIPIAIVTITGLIVIFDYFFNIPGVSGISGEIQLWGVLVSTFAMGLGLVNVIRQHTTRVMKRTGEWWLSVWLLICLALTLITGFIPPIQTHAAFTWIFDTVNKPLGGSMYAILAFFITSAVYRTFRARNADAFLLLLAGFFTLLNKAPIGGAIWPGFIDIGAWFLKVPNMAGMRGIIIGAAIGVTALGIRTLAGIETRAFGFGGD